MSMVTAWRSATNPARLREMVARGHLLGDLDSIAEVVGELRIAAEETLGVTCLSVYLRRGEGACLTPALGSDVMVPPLVARTASETRPLIEGDSPTGEIRGGWPLLVGDRLLGVALATLPGQGSPDPEDERPDLLGVLLGMAAQALERALLLDGRAGDRRVSQQRGRCLGLLHDLQRQLLGPWDLEEFLQQVVESVRDGVSFRMVLLRLYCPDRGGYVARASAGLPPRAKNGCYDRVVTREEIAPLFSPDFRLSRSYFISHQAPLWEGREERTYVPDLGSRGEGEWDARDCLLVPVEDAHGDRVGYLSVDDPEDRQPPSRETIANLEVFADLVALGLERDRWHRERG